MKNTLIILLCCLTSLVPGGEAAQYFAEYREALKNGVKHGEAYPKLQAAIALEPGNVAYRYEELKCQARITGSLGWEQCIPRLYEDLARIERFKQDFPDCKKPLYGHETIQYDSTNGLRYITDEQRKRMGKFLDIYRPLNYEEMKKIWYPHDLSDGINDFKELEHYSDCVIIGHRFSYYCDYKRWYEGRYRVELEFLKQATEFARKNPDQMAKIEAIVQQHNMTDLGQMREETELFGKIKNYLKSTDEYIELAEKGPFKSTKRFALQLRYMRKLGELPPDREQIAACLMEYFAEDHKLNPLKYRRRDYRPHLGFAMITMISFQVHETRFVYKCLDRYLESLPEGTAWETVENIISRLHYAGATVDELLPYVAELQKNSLKRFHDNPLANTYQSIPVLNSAEFFKAVNGAFEIDYGKYQDFTGTAKVLACVGAVQSGDRIFLVLIEKEEDSRFPTTSYLGELNSSFVRKIPLARKELVRGSYTPWDEKVPMAVSDDYIVVNGADKIAVYDRKAESWQVIDDILSDPVLDMVIAQGRIYILCGGVRQDIPASLISMLPDGSQRKTHFNNARSEKKSEPDGLKGMYSSLTVLNDNELAFLLTDVYKKSGIFKLKIDEDKIERLATIPDAARSYMGKRGKYLYPLGHGGGYNIYRVDSETGNVQCLLTTVSGDKTETLCHLEGGYGIWLSYPYMVIGNRVWVGGNFPAVFDLDDPEKSPFLLVPRSSFMFEASGEMIYLNYYHYFRIKRK